ncbi:MAG: isoprenyl transferase [Anaerorhabdus sp.]
MDKLKHIAIIMDGNGRWAKKQNKERTHGHFQGATTIRDIAIEANEMGIEVLTLFAFSTENWKRPLEEVEFLMKLPFHFFNKFLKELNEKNIRIQMIGFEDKVPSETMKLFKEAIDKTKNNTGMTLCFAMNYGGRAEIVHSINQYANDVASGKAKPGITEEEFAKYLMTKEYSEVDCLIRTSGESRISNFLLWQIAYSELLFVEKAWPEFTPEDFKKCCEDFMMRNRRFGGIQK